MKSNRGRTGKPVYQSRGGGVLRSIAAVVAGYLTTVILVVLTIALAGVVTGVQIGTDVTTSYILVNLVGSLLAAIAGGWVAARLAHGAPERHVAALAILVLLLSIYSASTPPTSQPGWYSYGLVAIGVVGVLIGGWIALRRRPAA